MMIEKMSIKNFRKFEKLNIELAPQMNVIAGNNAAGKSTILEALAFLALKVFLLHVLRKRMLGLFHRM